MKIELPKSLYDHFKRLHETYAQKTVHNDSFGGITFIGPIEYYTLIAIPDEDFGKWKREYFTKWNIVQDHLDTIIKIQEERKNNETR